MNLRNSKRNYEEKIHSSIKDAKSLVRRKRKLLQSNENIQKTPVILPKTHKKCERKICLDDSYNFGSNMSFVTSTPVPCEIRIRRVSLKLKNSNHEPADRKNKTSNIPYPITSTPIQVQTVSTKANKQKSDHLLKKKSVQKNTSQTSMLSVDSVNENIRSSSNKSTGLTSQHSMTLRSQHSQRISFNRSTSKSSVTSRYQRTKKASYKSSSQSKTSLQSQHSRQVSFSGSLSESTTVSQPQHSLKISHKSSSNHSMALRSHSSNNTQEAGIVNTPRKSLTETKGQMGHLIKNTGLQDELCKRKQKSAGSAEKQRSSKRICKNLATSSKRSPILSKKVSTKSCTKPPVTKENETVLQNIQKTSHKMKTLTFSKSFVGQVTVDDLLLSTKVRKVKSADFKLPSKTSLKRKREALDTLRKVDEEYQDDIFETKTNTFNKFKELLMNTSDSDSSFASISTPKLGFQVTPRIPHKTPKFRDCFSPTEYAISRKIAEEYMQKRKNKKRASQPPITPPVIPEKKKLEFSQVVADAQKIQEICEKLIDESDDDDNDDNSYFSLC